MNRPLLIILSVTVLACDDGGPSASDSNTNWLRACGADSECGDELRCLCGVCTSSCESDAVCAASGAGATCLPTSGEGAPSSCTGDDAAGAAMICAAPCEGDTDCRAELMCQDGQCVRRPSPPADAGDAAPDGAPDGGSDAGLDGDTGGRVEEPCRGTVADPSPACSGVDCPVVADVTLRCSYVSDIGVGVGDPDGYLYVHAAATGLEHGSQLLTVSAAGAEQVDITDITRVESGSAPVPTLFAVDASGAPYFMQFEPTRSTLRGAGAGTEWTVEIVTADGSNVGGALWALGPPGFHAVLAGRVLLARTPSTTWEATSTAIDPTLYGGSISTVALDATGVPLLAYWEPTTPERTGPLGLKFGPAGEERSVATNSMGYTQSAMVVVAPEGMAPVVTYNIPDGIHVLVAGETPENQIIPTTTPPTPVGCENDVDQCRAACTERADGATPRAFGLARSADATWIAWRQVHIDRDVTFVEMGDEGRWCERQVTADRSSYHVVVGRVAADGAVEERLRIETPLPGGFDIVRLAARGNRLLVAATAGMTGEASEVRYLELDASTL